MKTLMNMMIVLLLMANVAIAQAVNYPTYNSNQYQTTVRTTIAPAQNSQVYSGTYQNSNLTPMVDNNGIAVEPYGAAPGRPRKAPPAGWDCGVNGHYDEDEDGVCDKCDERCIKGEGVHVGTPGDTVDDGRLPIGSILILLLFALMHVAFIAYSTRKNKA